ncbi:MAG: ABC transporter ATP-binding protein [Myxococcota bacterium]
MSVIAVENLQKRYGDNFAVKGLDLQVEEGEVFAILGPNGAGKTSTVEILEGHRRRSGGNVTVLGFDPETGGRAFRERIGIVLQEAGFDEAFTARELLCQFARFYPKPRDVDELLALVGLEEKADARSRTLSGGQRRRLDLALGLVGDPDLLFLDEPTTGFDPSARRQAWELVAGLCRGGKTVVLTTHYMEEAYRLADRVALVVGGRLVAQGTPDELVGRSTGGRSFIRFDLPSSATLSDLPAVSGEVELDGEQVAVRSLDPTRDLRALTGWALERGLPLEHLHLERRSFEDAYLELVAQAEVGAEGSAPPVELVQAAAGRFASVEGGRDA